MTAALELLYQSTSWEYIQFLQLANDGSIAFLGDEGDNILERIDMPIQYIQGVKSQVIEKIENALEGHQVGDLVQSVYDYVNIAWKTVLAGGTILLMTRLALDGGTMADHWVMVLAFFSMLMLAAAQGFFPDRQGLARFLRSVAATCTFLVLLLYLVLPLAVFGASRLSERLTRPLIQESYDTYTLVSRTFTFRAIEIDYLQLLKSARLVILEVTAQCRFRNVGQAANLLML